MDYRVEFSKWWVSEFKTIKFPSQGTVFDYVLDVDTKRWVPWTERLPAFELDPEIPLQVRSNLPYIKIKISAFHFVTAGRPSPHC